jgi:hypothetical protein
MRTSHKIEIFTGIATPVATLMYLYFGVIRILLFQADFRRTHFYEGINGTDICIFIACGVIWLFSLMLGFGAYRHVKGSELAVDSIYLGGWAIIVFLGLWGLLIFVFGGGLYGAMSYFPVILSFITMVMAAYSQERNTAVGLNLKD